MIANEDAGYVNSFMAIQDSIKGSTQEGKYSSITINANSIEGNFSEAQKVNVFKAWGGNIAVTSGSIDVKNVDVGFAAEAFQGSDAVLKVTTTGDVIMHTVGGEAAHARFDSTNSAQTNITSEKGNIELVSETAEGRATVSVTDVSADTVTGTANGYGELRLTAAGTLTVKNTTDDGMAIFVESGVGDKASLITADAASIVIEGNIQAEDNTNVVIGKTDNSSTIEITGAITDGNLQTGGQQLLTAQQTGITLHMGEGSVWNVTGDSSVSSIAGNGTVKVGATESQGQWSIDHSVKIGSVESGKLNLGFNGVDADDISVDEFKSMMDADQKISTSASVTAKVDGGNIYEGLTWTQTDAGSEVSGGGASDQLKSFGSVNVTNLMQWRHEMNDLTKRMGELRLSPEGVGTWARLYGSEQKYGDMGTETKNTSIQVGADYDVGAGWKVGAAFSYTDSSSSMDNGSADGDMYGFALYGTWLNDDGQFVDLIAKYSRLSTDFTAGNMSGDYDNNAYSVSAEYGWHLKLGDIAFVEPQAELTYGQVMGDDFTANNAVRVEQDDVDSFIGRIGVRGGFVFPENKGNVYLRASVLHDFDGETSFKASNDSASIHLTDDLGGTWYEFGVGANFNLTDSTYTYVDLEKTTGGEVQENWRWNVGLRHVW